MLMLDPKAMDLRGSALEISDQLAREWDSLGVEEKAVYERMVRGRLGPRQ